RASCLWADSSVWRLLSPLPRRSMFNRQIEHFDPQEMILTSFLVRADVDMIFISCGGLSHLLAPKCASSQASQTHLERRNPDIRVVPSTSASIEAIQRK